MKDHQTDRWQLQSFLRSKLFKEYKNIDKLPIQTNKPTTKLNAILTLVCLQSHNITLRTVKLCQQTEGKSGLGRRKCKWKYNIKMIEKNEMGWACGAYG